MSSRSYRRRNNGAWGSPSHQDLLRPRPKGPRTDPLALIAAAAERELSDRQARAADEDAESTRDRCRSLIGFIREAWPILEPATNLKIGWAIEAIADHLQAVSDGHILRLLINCPPGMMKSLLTTVFWPAHEWGPQGRPGLRILGSSYREDYAVRDTGRMRNLVVSPWYQALWPTPLLKDGERKFENESHGWRAGVPFGSLTGDRGDRVVLDDPNNVITVESGAERARTGRIFLESVPKRTNDPETSAIIAIQQRTHIGDVSGIAVAKALGYVHLMLPMGFEPDRKCVTYRRDGTQLFEDPRTEAGELLFPERFPAETVARDEVPLGAYGVASQHQQRPAPREGGLFKPAMIEIVDAVPVRMAKLTRAWDFAATKVTPGMDPDWTVGVLMGRCDEGFFWIVDVKRFREGPHIVRRTVVSTAAADGPEVHVRGPQDPGQAGKAQAEDFVRALAGYPVTFKPVSGDKEIRATPFAAQVNAGNVRMLKAHWNQAFIDELGLFPVGHDDQIDAASDAFSDVAGVAGAQGWLDYARQQLAARDKAAEPAPIPGSEPPTPRPSVGAPEHLMPYVRYLENVGCQISNAKFDEDWDPVGRQLRAMLVDARLAVQTRDDAIMLWRVAA